MKEQTMPGWQHGGRRWWLAGLLALACAAPVRSEVISFSYTNATVTSGTSSAYLGFNPATGAFQMTDDLFGSGIIDTYNVLLLGDNRGGPGVTFYPMGAVGPSAANPYVSAHGSDVFVDYVASNAVVGASLAYGGSLQLSSLPIGESGYVGMNLFFDYSGDACYGWAEIKRTDEQSYTLLATAYNASPNEALQAGQLSLVPEPTSGLLVLAGCAGFALWRRRPRTRTHRT